MAKAKTKTKRTTKPQPLTSGICEECILQLSNDLSEGIASGTVEDWREVALYFRKACDEAHRELEWLREGILLADIASKAPAGVLDEAGGIVVEKLVRWAKGQ